MSTWPTRVKPTIFDKLKEADVILGITKSMGMKKGPLNIFTSGRAGVGKSLANAAFQSDTRLSAISRDGNKVEINYHSYAAENIPGFLDWIAHHGVEGYDMEGPFIVFHNLTDADLFWLTFTGVGSNRFMQMSNRRDFSYEDAKREIDRAKLYAKETGAPIYTHTEHGMALIKTNSYRINPEPA